MWFKIGDLVFQEDVWKFIKEVDEFVFVSYLYWVFWGLLLVRVYFIYYNEFVFVVFGYQLLICFDLCIVL